MQLTGVLVGIFSELLAAVAFDATVAEPQMRTASLVETILSKTTCILV